jgi:hypothetical protein
MTGKTEEVEMWRIVFYTLTGVASLVTFGIGVGVL